MTDEPLLVPVELLRAVFDIATNSLDFGSGFLDDEDVEQLRAVARILEVDPWLATPDNHKPAYCFERTGRDDHEYGNWTYPRGYEQPSLQDWRRCKHCGQTQHRSELAAA